MAQVKGDSPPERVTRANGEASRRRILDAAREIAGERGYAGTSISEVSKRSGLPNSSIYWHFKDKDALFAAVISDSYEQWRVDFDARAGEPRSTPGEVLARLHESLSSFPEFLRFGLLVVLEQRDEEIGARAEFLRIRRRALKDLATIFEREARVDSVAARHLAALALAMNDGAFVAGVAGERTLSDSDSLGRAFDSVVDGESNRRSGR